MAIALTTLLPLMNVARCPQARMVQALRNACRDFCRDTEVWRETLASFNTVVNQAAYTLATGHANTIFIRVPVITVDGVPYNERNYTVSPDGVLVFDPAPNAIRAVAAEAVLMPTLLCNSVADKLVNRFGEYIAAGAEFILKADKGTETDPHPWFDPNGAVVARTRFEKGVGVAKAEIFTDRQSGLKNIQPIGGIWR